jgi:hypothetical protein
MEPLAASRATTVLLVTSLIYAGGRACVAIVIIKPAQMYAGSFRTRLHRQVRTALAKATASLAEARTRHAYQPHPPW